MSKLTAWWRKQKPAAVEAATDLGRQWVLSEVSGIAQRARKLVEKECGERQVPPGIASVIGQKVEHYINAEAWERL